MAAIEQLNAETRGPEEYRARYGPTRLSDMSLSEFKDIHLSDEKLAKAPGLYGRSWGRSMEKDRYETEGQRHITYVNAPHDNVHVIIRKKRAILPMQVDW